MQPLSINPDDFCFIDTETRSSVDVTVAGAYAHTAAPDFCVMIVTYAIGNGPVQRWHIANDVAEIGSEDLLDWRRAPADLAAFIDRVRSGEAWLVAWNAAFDRLALNRGLNGLPVGETYLPIKCFLDAMVQACRSHLPPDLMGASTVMACPIPKRPTGKALIKLFAVHDGGTPASHPDEWLEYLRYASDDIDAMRTIWFDTLPLPATEWQEYWVSEGINDRGMPVDRVFVEGAAQLAELNAELANSEVERISGGALYSVNQHKAMLAWIMARVGHLPQAEPILTREVTLEPDDEGEDVAVAELSLGKENVKALIAYLLALDEAEGLTDAEAEALDMLEVREYGGSATPKKFIKMLPMLGDDARLRGQYTFNGAATTGRYSSRGVQIHNLTRDTVGDTDAELDAIEMITHDVRERLLQETYDRLKAKFGPVGRTLSRLIRPAFVAPVGKTFVWSDWSAIEAVGLPWLADSEGADRVLDIIEASQQDKTKPDIYQTQAGLILGKLATEISKKERQAYGKVPVLSLGYGGGVGALQSMAHNYGVSFDDDLAERVVEDYREANPWMTAFWAQLWEAANSAYGSPGDWFEAGRVSYGFDPGYMGGTLMCMLPCTRLLLYPKIKWEKREQKNRKTGVVTTKIAMTYRRGYGRAPLWGGLLAENVTQAACASLLRWSHGELERRAPGLLVGHTHDENVGLCASGLVGQMRTAMRVTMTGGPAWAKGMPLAVSVTDNDWYTKTLD